MTEEGCATNPVCFHDDNKNGLKIKLQISMRETPVMPVVPVAQTGQDYFGMLMTPQDDRTAEVLSNALGRSTITAISESLSRVRGLEDSANVSRRSEERALISANELLRFSLDEVLVLPEGQYPIRARHIRYYEDRYFAPIELARTGKKLPLVVPAGLATRRGRWR